VHAVFLLLKVKVGKVVLIMPIARCALSVLLLFGCNGIDPYENFRQLRQSQVGKNADDPSTDVGRLYSNRIGEKILPNGNLEVGFTRGPDCQYFYEIEKPTRRIAGWRSEENCFTRP
jgi:hypothetical protein